MALPPNFLDELRARTPLAPLIGRRVRLARNGRQWKGCCPFHNEKTPSFYVYDDHYHCFGCGQHGDAIGFTMQTEGLAFREAVERLAGEAGLEVPRESPRQVAKEARARDLHDVLQAACEAMQRRLRAPEGRPALDYLRGRGLTEETIARFGLGWSGAGRGALAADLKPLGHRAAPARGGRADQAGGGAEGAYNDFFYNRVMFPIRDRRGRIVSFGGRILGEGQPKYLNGPETDVFSKRRTLYGLDMAREAVFRGKARAGRGRGLHGRHRPAPGGLRGRGRPARHRADGRADGGDLAHLARARPLPRRRRRRACAPRPGPPRWCSPCIGTERTLHFATLPQGQDPDDLIARRAPRPSRPCSPRPSALSVALYDLMAEGRPLGTPEGRAAFRNDLAAAAGRIPDKSLASEYRRVLLNRFFESSRPPRPVRPPFTPGARKGAPFRPPPRLPPRAAPEAGNTRLQQARCLLAITLAHPWLLNEVEEAFALLELPHGPPSALQAALLAWHAGRALTDVSEGEAASLDSADLVDHLNATGLEEARAWVMGAPGLPREASPDAQPAETLDGWWHFFGFLRGEGALVEDLDAAGRDLVAANDAAAQSRVIRLSQALSALRRGETGLEAELESGRERLSIE